MAARQIIGVSFHHVYEYDTRVRGVALGATKSTLESRLSRVHGLVSHAIVAMATIFPWLGYNCHATKATANSGFKLEPRQHYGNLCLVQMMSMNDSRVQTPVHELMHKLVQSTCWVSNYHIRQF
jgi:hypothetical protein